MSCLVLSCFVLSRVVLSCFVLLWFVLSCLVLFYLVLSCLVLSCSHLCVGTAWSLPVYGVGTAAFLVRDAAGDTSLLLLHNCLLTKGGEFNLISVSQMQASGLHSVDFASELPQLYLRSSAGLLHVPMQLTDGLYSVVLEPISINDVRYLQFSHINLTDNGDYTPPTTGSPARL